ncbi:conserved hypothetical protein [Leishmania major strain Friedlin]|uniref:Uncharacterized protein n=1 Tax=Leishmania major TaxID=5664 RepID=Q4QEB7_LEIMA|nr:conserved hypothetical protein [Leishmania major strain Friedlin]CAG9572306.1 hypothetical_protein_-_conserved [Leishmania major strain Friedlin]CAJ03650.1 conserved hypothetical protein [Leishmania major strain Friedlin]|eukprot:XP_001682331.1 conserved hypothetical protein [Leishmania major strain Friedlin]
MPAALLREAREVVQEAKESFTKPWRVQDQQREDTLLHLLNLRRSKLAAVAQLVAELRQVDRQLLHVTEAKGLDVANWRYQQRELYRKMEKLHRGATALASCFALASPSSTASGATDLAVGKSQAAATACPSLSHTQCVAQKELAKVRETLQIQLAQLEEEERASAQRLETWHRLLSEVPWGGNASGDFSCTADTTGGEKDGTQHARPSAAAPSAAAAGMIHTPAHDPPPQPCGYYSELWRASEAAAGVPLQQEQQQTPSLSAAPGTNTAVADRGSPHPSDAEVVLLQHALHNINGALRQRLLRAAAASLASSSSSRSPTTSHHTSGGEEAAAASVTISGLPPLPDVTPLRSMQDFMKSPSGSSSAVLPCAQQSEAHPSERLPGSANAATAAYASQSGKGQQQEMSPLPRCTEATALGAPAEAVTAGAALDAAEEAQRRVWWQSLQAREQAMKDSLNQLLQSVTTTSSPPSRERGSVDSADDAGRPAGSAIFSSISAHQRSLESR